VRIPYGSPNTAEAISLLPYIFFFIYADFILMLRRNSIRDVIKKIRRKADIAKQKIRTAFLPF
ncbi:MAG: hypothetical protein RRY76_00900, partial [Clostridia bacterium]